MVWACDSQRWPHHGSIDLTVRGRVWPNLRLETPVDSQSQLLASVFVVFYG
jgi:hypothetical protein